MSTPLITIRDLLDRGPAFVRAFIDEPRELNEFTPEFSWLLLADSVGVQYSIARDNDPAAAACWADIAADLYEGLVRGLRPQDDLARDIWSRKAARYRAQAISSLPPANVAPDTREPHPI